MLLMRTALTENQSDQTRTILTAYATSTPLPGYAGAWTYTNLVTEKSNQLTDELRTYMFEVNPLATKPEIKQAAEVLFNIKISSVRTMNVRGKTRGNRFKMGRLSHWKKAYVTLQPDSPALDLF